MSGAREAPPPLAARQVQPSCRESSLSSASRAPSRYSYFRVQSGFTSPAYSSPRRTIRRVIEPERCVHQLFDERHTIEFHELNVRLEAPVDREADLPRAGIDVRILDGRFIHQVIRPAECPPLDDVQIGRAHV